MPQEQNGGANGLKTPFLSDGSVEHRCGEGRMVHA